MTFEQAQQIANEYGYSVHMIGGDRKWFSAMKIWDETAQTIALQVQIKDNGGHAFKFTHMLMNGIVVTTGELGSMDNQVHFLKWQRMFMETIEKII